MLFTSTNLFTKVHRMQAVNENTYIQISNSKKWHSTVLKIIFTYKVRLIKGQIILKRFFGVFDFLQKTNENKST